MVRCVHGGGELPLSAWECASTTIATHEISHVGHFTMSSVPSVIPLKTLLRCPKQRYYNRRCPLFRYVHKELIMWIYVSGRSGSTVMALNFWTFICFCKILLFFCRSSQQKTHSHKQAAAYTSTRGAFNLVIRVRSPNLGWVVLLVCVISSKFPFQGLSLQRLLGKRRNEKQKRKGQNGC